MQTFRETAHPLPWLMGPCMMGASEGAPVSLSPLPPARWVPAWSDIPHGLEEAIPSWDHLSSPPRVFTCPPHPYPEYPSLRLLILSPHPSPSRL